MRLSCTVTIYYGKFIIIFREHIFVHFSIHHIVLWPLENDDNRKIKFHRWNCFHVCVFASTAIDHHTYFVSLGDKSLWQYSLQSISLPKLGYVSWTVLKSNMHIAKLKNSTYIFQHRQISHSLQRVNRKYQSENQIWLIWYW